MSRAAWKRMTKRILEQNHKNGGTMSTHSAQKIAEKIAIRHDQKNNK
tara:strand:- start:600 stop:740 length:141 start_codon:yes stop_codon:yes gene_type:complete